MLKLLNLYPKTIADFKDLEINVDTSKVSQEELIANLDKSISLSEECLKSLNTIRAVIDRKVIILLSFLIGYLSLLSLNFPSILKFGQHYHGMGIKFVHSILALAMFYLIIAIYVAIIGFVPKGEVTQGAEPKELAGIINLNNDIYKLTWLSRLQKKISYNGYIVTRYSKLLSYAVLATVLAPALSLMIIFFFRF